MVDGYIYSGVVLPVATLEMSDKKRSLIGREPLNQVVATEDGLNKMAELKGKHSSLDL
jgi:hypothetical protein